MCSCHLLLWTSSQKKYNSAVLKALTLRSRYLKPSRNEKLEIEIEMEVEDGSSASTYVTPHIHPSWPCDLIGTANTVSSASVISISVAFPPLRTPAKGENWKHEASLIRWVNPPLFLSLSLFGLQGALHPECDQGDRQLLPGPV